MASQGVTALLQRDGYLQFVLGNQLDDAEYEAIKTGYALREKIGEDLANCLASFDDVESNLFNKRMDALQQLIVARRLEIKIAYRKPGIVHNKIGLLYDEAGDAICFSGSANETDAAWLRNSEDISVFESWAEHSAEYFEFYEQQFDDFWHNRAAGNHVVNFEQADYEKLIHRIDRLSKDKFFLSETGCPRLKRLRHTEAKRKRVHTFQIKFLIMSLNCARIKKQRSNLGRAMSLRGSWLLLQVPAKQSLQFMGP